MSGIDFARLRNQTLADGQDSEVTVNTRALIDKVLARYSSEHTTLRELIQNASDAGASTVVIKFETDPSSTVPVPQGADRNMLLKHTIQHHTLKRLTVSNNGQPFSNADWSRLKSIADGNPDETKIGAFGVGFYSVFSDCDEPFVVSGLKTMAFYWKGNTLSTKMATIPSEQSSGDTTFFLDYRQANPASPSFSPSKIPNLPTLCQFLATSLTFVGLQSIELHLDDFKVATFVKKVSPPTEIALPNGLKPTTEGGLLTVTKVTLQHSQLEAEWSNVLATAQNPPRRAAEVVHSEIKQAGSALKSFFSRFSTPPAQASSKSSKAVAPPEAPSNPGEDISGESKGVIFLQVLTVEVQSKVSKSFSAEIERATKKPPPRITRVALLTSPYHSPTETLSSTSGNTANLAAKIFQQVLPTTDGRIFIGFPTAQTTPFLAHISAPSLIPTVERENVDMNARYISTWNTELLRVAGLACRISYSLDMATLRDRADKEPIAALVPQAAYICKQFTAKKSHPSTVLGARVVEAFFDCSKDRAISILASTGIKSSHRVRMPAETLSFLRDVPMVPQELATEAVEFFVDLHNRGFISELTMEDIRDGLDSRALNEEELIEFLRWCGTKLESGELDQSSVRTLFDVTVANIGVDSKGNTGKILALTDIKSFVNAARTIPGLPVPPDTIPFDLSKGLPTKQLMMFGWRELHIVRWLQFLTTGPQLNHLTTQESIAMQVLGSAAKAWDQLDNASKEALIKTLSPHAVMPTKMGLRRPAESYFPSVKLFDDLPTVKQFAGSKEKFLVALGVRKTVDLPTVFDRLKKGDASLNHGDLIRYFASVVDEIPPGDLNQLRLTPFLPGEGASINHNAVFQARDLYAPSPAVLSFGLNQIKLPFEFRANSREANFLFKLGLKRYPNSTTLCSIMQHAGKANTQQLWTRAMQYFLENYFSNGYGAERKDVGAIHYGFLPTEQAPFPNLIAPFQCFTNPKAACLGYAILRGDLRPHADKFAVQQDPDIKDCVQRLLKSPPASKLSAEEIFSYLATRAGEFDDSASRSLVQQISSAKIVPIFRRYYIEAHSAGFEDRHKHQTGKSELRVHHYDSPETVFVGMDEAYRGIIDYVHYSGEATAFLLKVGAKHEPSSYDLASLLCDNPLRFLNTIGQERYLDLLRKLAENAEALWKDKDLVKRMGVSPILLGYRDIKDDTKKAVPAEDDAPDDLEEIDFQREWSLNRATEVVIIDDVQAMTRFREYIIVAPLEEQLEEFYARIGVKKISELVKAERRIGVATRDQTSAHKLLKDILERARLFLHEYDREGSKKSIRHDARWLALNLQVQCVSDISIRYTLAARNVTTSSTKTAAIVKIHGGGYMLNITPKYDLYEVSTDLIRIMINRPKRNDAIALERILTEPLKRLQARGINVERILRRKEQEARLAKQHELEREQEEKQRLEEQAKANPQPQPDVKFGSQMDKENIQRPEVKTPEKTQHMPGAFGTPDQIEQTNDRNANESIDNFISRWKKEIFGDRSKSGSSAPRKDPQGPQIDKDLQSTRANIASAIRDCRPAGQAEINTRQHQDPTELDNGGYCSGEQWHNLRKAFSRDVSGRTVDVYVAKDQTETPQDLHVPLGHFLHIILNLTRVFGVDPSAVNIFVNRNTSTIAFNMSGTLFFNLAWFMAQHAPTFTTLEGRTRAMDSWFLTYCHELAHNLVQDHNARHNWYNAQIAIEFSPKYRQMLNAVTEDVAALGLN